METITEEFVKNVLPDRGQRIVWDDKIPGFGVRITAAGTIAFILNYTSGDKSSNGKKKRKRVKIGRYPAMERDDSTQESRRVERRDKQLKRPT